MTSTKLLFLQLRRPDQIEKVLKKINVWSNIVLFKGPDSAFKVQSLKQFEQTFEISFTALSPIEGDCFIRFEIENIIYQIDGQLELKNEDYIFNFKEFHRELKRRLLRLEVPEDYPGFFDLNEVAGQKIKEETRLMDMTNDGFLFSSKNSLSIKLGDLVTGHIRIRKLPAVQIAGVIRHCMQKDGKIMAGVEIHHLEFGSEEKMAELITFFKLDVKSNKPS